MKFRVFWDVAPIALMMEAVRTSETSVHSNKTTLRYIPEDSKLKIACLYWNPMAGEFFIDYYQVL
jgi:hypothetical protein